MLMHIVLIVNEVMTEEILINFYFISGVESYEFLVMLFLPKLC